MWHFTVPLPPKGQARPRMAVVAGHAHTYKHDSDRDREGAVAYFARAALGDVVLDGPVALEVTAVFARPKRLLTRKAPQGRIPHTSRPDLDNQVKLIADSLKSFWHDDAQIAEVVARKVYGAIGEQAHTEVTVRTLGEAAA